VSPNTDFALPLSIGSAVAIDAADASKSHFNLRTFLLSLSAMLATVASLTIAAFAGWQRGGLPIERVMNVSLCCVAVLYVHWLPVVWRAVTVVARICAFAVWWLALAVVLFGQVSFFMLSQQHAGDVRAASITVPAGPPGAAIQAGRTRTQITQDIASVKAALARANARRCTGDCTALAARRQTLTARLAALDTEDDEALRREADQDRDRKRADRVDALRDMSRADPVARVVAARLHTTENVFGLIVGVACAVVLEGAAIVGWLLASVVIGRERGREAVVSGRTTVMPEPHVIESEPYIKTSNSAVGGRESEKGMAVHAVTLTYNDAGPVVSEDERLLKKIHDAVLAGKAEPTQVSIRKLLRCGQPKAGRLNRLYQNRVGGPAQTNANV